MGDKMKTLRGNAEVNFRSILAAIKTAKEGWHVQHFQLSQITQTKEAQELDKLLFGLITENMAEHEGFVFFCADNDIIVLVKAVTTEAINRVAEQFIGLAADRIRDPKSLIQNFDLGKSWDAFTNLCEQKIILWNEKQKQIKVPKPTYPVVAKEHVNHAHEKLLEIGKAERASRKRPCVMLVEDDAASMFMARKALDDILTVATASSAAEAKKNYMNTMPDVVFLDIGLPDGSGHDVLQDIMGLDDDAYVVMLSGNSFEQDIIKAMRRGAKGFVGKPFSRAKLLQYIYQSPHCLGFSASNRVV